MEGKTGSSSMQRRYDLDWLRVLGSVLVVLAHCASSFSPWSAAGNPAVSSNGSFGYIQTNKLFSEFLWILNLWLMPLFMLLAGASVWYMLGKRSNKEYLRERLSHLGLPFALLFLGFVLPSGYFTQVYLGNFHGSFLDFAFHFFDGILPNGNFALMHLWFLVYLLIYSALTLPLFRFLRGDTGRKVIDRLARVCQPLGGIYVFALPLLAVQLALSGMWPQPVFPALVNDWTRFAFLLLTFVFGYILVSGPRLQSAIARQWPLAAGVALVTSAVLIAIAWPDSFNPYRDQPADYSGYYIWFWTLFTISSWSWVVALLGLAQRFLNSGSALLRSACAASFPLYLLHPIIWIPAIFLVAQVNVPTSISFLLMAILVLGGTVSVIALLKRLATVRLPFRLNAEPTRAASSTPAARDRARALYSLPIISTLLK